MSPAAPPDRWRCASHLGHTVRLGIRFHELGSACHVMRSCLGSGAFPLDTWRMRV